MSKPSVTHHVFTPEAIVVGDHDIYTLDVTIAAGQSLDAGAVLGRVTADDEYVLSLAAAADGSDSPICVLMEGVDASAEAKTGRAWFAAGLDSERLTFGTGHTAESVRLDLAARGIFLYASQGL